jgi:hypothetical protein
MNNVTRVEVLLAVIALLLLLDLLLDGRGA